MAGIDASTDIVYRNNSTFTKVAIGSYVDTIFTNNPSSIVTESTGNQTVDVSTSGHEILAIDQSGNTHYQPIVKVRKVTIASLPAAPQIIKIIDQIENTLICSSDTPVCTRINNIVNAQPVGDFTLGDSVCCGLTTYTPSASGIQQVDLPPNENWIVPNVITATWGEFECSRTDAYSFVEVCQNYPEAVDPNDIHVFEAILGEMTIYADIQTMSDITSTYTGTALYWIETDASTDYSAFQCNLTSTEVGYPQPPPSSAPHHRHFAASSAIGTQNKTSTNESQTKKKSRLQQKAADILKQIQITKGSFVGGQKD